MAGHADDVASTMITWANQGVTMTWASFTSAQSTLAEYALEGGIKPTSGSNPTLSCFEPMILALVEYNWISQSDLAQLYRDLIKTPKAKMLVESGRSALHQPTLPPVGQQQRHCPGRQGDQRPHRAYHQPRDQARREIVSADSICSDHAAGSIGRLITQRHRERFLCRCAR